MRISVVGSVNLDLVARVRRLPRPGETVTGADLARIPGGKGGNQAVAAARLGAEVSFLGCVGDDAFAAEATAGLREAGVDLTRLRRVEGPTGVALITVDDDGENEIVVAPGANAHLRAEDVRVEGAEAVLCQLEIPAGAVAAAAARCEGLFCLNPAPARPVAAAVLDRADLVVANRFELEALGRTPPGLVALTLGADGAVLLLDGEEVARCAPPAVDAVDGTAAGDAFCAALVVSLLERRPREEALRRACAAGALAASRPGAQPSLPTSAEIDAILAA